MQHVTIRESHVVIEKTSTPEGAARVLAAAINPIDFAIGSGKFFKRAFSDGDTLGYSGVAQTLDGERVYFQLPHPPAGSFAEYVDLSDAFTAPVPDNLDSLTAAVLGVPGIAAVGAIECARVSALDTVLITGANGNLGLLAGRAALNRGAHVVAMVRSAQALEAVQAYGMTGFITQDPSAPEIAEVLAECAPGGIDVVIDQLSGPYVGPMMSLINNRARWIQIGSGAGTHAEFTTSIFRTKGISMLGYTNFLLSDTEGRNYYAQACRLYSQGVTLPYTSITLDQFEQTWNGLAGKELRGKYVVKFE